MGIEIERKFLVKGDSWKNDASEGLACTQGYLFSNEEKAVRVRIIGREALLTIKGATLGISRTEFEYSIPVEDANAMLNLCGDTVEKIRYFIGYAGMTWEVDVFLGSNEGLVLAEIELDSEDQTFELPSWADKEVSSDIRYFNSNLARNPYSTW